MKLYNLTITLSEEEIKKLTDLLELHVDFTNPGYYKPITHVGENIKIGFVHEKDRS